MALKRQQQQKKVNTGTAKKKKKVNLGELLLWATGSMVSWENWDKGSIPGPALWIKDLILLQLQIRLRWQLRSDPWPRNSICWGVAKNEKKKKKEKLTFRLCIF